VYDLIREHPELYKREKEQYRIEVALSELGLGPFHNLKLADLLPFLKIRGITSALALYLVHLRRLYKPANFDKFCDDHLTRGRDAGHRQISYAEVYLDLLGIARARKNQPEQETVRRHLREAHVRALLEVESDKQRYILFHKLAHKVGHKVPARGSVTAKAIRLAMLGANSVPAPPDYRAALIEVQEAIRRIYAAPSTGTTTRFHLQNIDDNSKTGSKPDASHPSSRRSPH
jgi:hypothetical protein